VGEEQPAVSCGDSVSVTIWKFGSVNVPVPPAPVPGGTWADKGILLKDANRKKIAVKPVCRTRFSLRTFWKF
jgi:hypothetical protein